MQAEGTANTELPRRERQKKRPVWTRALPVSRERGAEASTKSSVLAGSGRS